MNVEELKYRLREIFGEQVLFNKEFDDYAITIKNLDVNLVMWCQKVKEEEIKPVPTKDKQNLIFIKKIGSSNRCIVIKIINGEFKEVHLGDHKYYDEIRKRFGIKQSSY